MARRNARSVAESIVVLSGCPNYLGTIDFGVSPKTNAQATAPFNTASPYLAGLVLAFQADQDCYILPVNTSTGTVSSTNGVLLFANEIKIITMEDYNRDAIDGDVKAWLSAVRSSASGNLKIWSLS